MTQYKGGISIISSGGIQQRNSTARVYIHLGISTCLEGILYLWIAVTGGFDSRFETLVKQMLLTSNNTVYNRNDRIFTHSSNINALPNITPLSKQQGIHLCHPSIRPNNMCSRPHQSLLYSITSVSDRGDIAVNFWLDFKCC